MEPQITSIKIKLGKKEAELTIEEAKKLKSALEDVFGVKKDTEVIHHYDWWHPWKIYTYQEPYKQDWGTVYCKNTSQTLCLDIN